MTIRLAINGFGRIGRTVTRILQNTPNMSLVAVNDLATPEQLAHLLKYDSIYGPFPKEIQTEESSLIIEGKPVAVSAERDPGNLAWKEHKVDIVLESTGVFRKREPLERHLKAGASKVVLAVPPKEPLDATVVFGVNDHVLTGSETLVSNASCTTNAAAPVIKVLHEAFTVKKGYLNTIHAYTNAQRIHDSAHKDFRRGRAAQTSIIPTTTGAAKAVTQVIPELQGRLVGMAYRVPVIDGSIVDMVLEFEQRIDKDLLNNTLEEASKTTHKGIIDVTSDPIVSCDIIGNPFSSILDAQLTQIIDDHTAHIACWYDNEFGYSQRLVELIQKIGPA